MDPVELVKDPETGYLVLPEDEGASGSAAPGKTPLVLTPIPNTSNPATYTAAIQLGDVVLAVDDFSEDEFNDLNDRESALIAQRTEAERLAKRHRAALSTCADEAEANGLADSLAASESDYDLAQKRIVALWREVSVRQIKGVRADDGQFYALGEGQPWPICTVPARRALVIALSRRASLGASEADFLPMR